MANKGLSMRKVREVLRLHYAAGLSTRAIARSLKVSPATVGKYIRRAEEQGLSWPLWSLDDPQDITSRLELNPEREQRLIALMAEAILAVLQDTRETDDDER